MSSLNPTACVQQEADSNVVSMPHLQANQDSSEITFERCVVDEENEHEAHNNKQTTSTEGSGHENICSKSSKRRAGRMSLVRVIFLDFPLTVIFSAAVLAHALSYVYDEYITEIFASADWRHTERLPDEMTYYDRWCDTSDITSFNMSDFSVSHKGTEEIVDTMMVHGLTIFPEILSPNTTSNLRNFVMKRNKEMTPAEAIPLDGEDYRWSYGIGGNDDPSVSKALREIATNSKLRSTLESLLGPDPAVVEITAITSAYGAEHQGMHSDVKALGNAVKYGRTFTHSYSLFIGLQDITEAMGATQICPGTHYCANDLADLCSEHGFTFARDGPLKAGGAMLMNQCLWHRGTEHLDPEAQHRVVFIVTFISRPRFGVDNRQLSHGTYFHIRWDMWGHTLNDLVDTTSAMYQPFTSLRTSGIWKPSGRHWGWDWLTVASLRIANEESGYSFEDLWEWVDRRNALGLPSFLRGPVVDENGGWATFISGTIQNIKEWITRVNAVAFTAYFVLIILATLINKLLSRQNGGVWKVVTSSTKRLLLMHAVVLSIGCVLVFEVTNSAWARIIKSGKLLARPFPDPESIQQDVNIGPTTAPEKTDILIGCRFDSRDLGAYDRFLDYHPGNRAWLELVSSLAAAYPSFTELSPDFRNAMVDQVVHDALANKSRFLLQNKFGDWVVMPRKTSREYTLREVVKMNNPLLRALDNEISYMLADSRYGLMLRSTKLGQKYAQSSLERWRKLLFHEDDLASDGLEMPTPAEKPVTAFGFVTRSLVVPRLSRSIDLRNAQFTSQHVDSADVFQEGDDIEIGWRSGGRLLRGTILSAERGGFIVQYLEDGEEDRVPDYAIRRYTGPLQEGDRVEAEYQGDGWFKGTIEYVYADRRVDVAFDDGDRSFGLEGDNVRRVNEESSLLLRAAA